MRKNLIGMLVIMLVLYCCINVFAEEKNLTSTDFQLERILLGKKISEKEIIKIFGKPYDIERPNPRVNYYSIVYFYEGLSIYINTYNNKRTFFRFDLEGDKFKLANGIKVGDPIDQVIEKYGLGGIGKKPSDESFMYVLPVDNSEDHSHFYYSVHFIRKNDRISKILGDIFQECDCDEP